MKEKLLEMFKLQDQLNKKINVNWKDIRTHEDFARATWIECAELVDSLPWKWWKKQEANIENVQIEVVDIWHFIMSYILLDYDNYKDLMKGKEIKSLLKGINEDFTNLNINAQVLNHYLGETDQFKKIIYITERVAEGFLKDNPVEGIFFFGILIKNTISFERLYLLYVGKNILNHIRQEKGYNSGKYQKVIEGLEDNHYLFKIVKEVKDINQLENKIRETFNKLHN